MKSGNPDNRVAKAIWLETTTRGEWPILSHKHLSVLHSLAYRRSEEVNVYFWPKTHNHKYPTYPDH